MKYLTLVRHGKSNNQEEEISDFDRRLTERGLSDALLIGSYIKDKLPKVDLIISSSALRSEDTAKIISDSIGYSHEKISYYDELYLCSVSEYIEILINQNLRHRHILLVSHNPGTTGFANILTNSDVISIPTCGFTHISLDIIKWDELEPGVGSLLSYISPSDIEY